MPPTKKVGKLIDQLYKLKLKIDEENKEIKKLEVKRDAVKEKYAAKEKEIFDSCDKQDIEGAVGTLAKVNINRAVMASVKDWPKLYAYIAKNDAFDLLQRRVANTAYKARLEEGKNVPGVEKFTKITLSLRKK